ncbi:MAG: hypothetical protein U0271_02375 [Polyangiaceae bacterium]
MTSLSIAHIRSARRLLTIVATGFALSATPASMAFADDDLDEEGVSADSDEEAEPAPPTRSKPHRMRKPEVGDPPYEIDAYLGELKRQTKVLKRRMKQAEREGDDEKYFALREKLTDKQAEYDAEKDRLTTNSPGLAAGGGVLIGVGCVSLVASIVALAGWGISAADGRPDDEWGYASLVSLLNGVAGIATGVPMLSIGLARRHRELPAEGRLVPTNAPLKDDYVAGATLTFLF